MWSSEFENVLFWLVGHKSEPSSRQSNVQRYFSRFSIVLCLLLFVESYLAAIGKKSENIPIIISSALSIYAVTMFYWVILVPPFAHRKSTNAIRLLGNTIISTVLMIAVFGLWYRTYGMEPSGTPLDALYFSAVTFSTLGFGDFSPAPNAQIFAAIQAIFGNLHLGFFVGATLFATNN